VRFSDTEHSPTRRHTDYGFDVTGKGRKFHDVENHPLLVLTMYIG
jgi:hypothetical protein